MLCLYRRVLYLEIGRMSAIGRTTPVVQRQTYLESSRHRPVISLLRIPWSTYLTVPSSCSDVDVDATQVSSIFYVSRSFRIPLRAVHLLEQRYTTASVIQIRSRARTNFNSIVPLNSEAVVLRASLPIECLPASPGVFDFGEVPGACVF